MSAILSKRGIHVSTVYLHLGATELTMWKPNRKHATLLNLTKARQLARRLEKELHEEITIEVENDV